MESDQKETEEPISNTESSKKIIDTKRKSVREKFKEWKKKQKDKNMRDNFTLSDKLSRLEQYDLEDKRDPLNVPFWADETFRGPTMERKITDLGWIIVFGVLNAIFLGFAIYGLLGINTEIHNGDVNRLINGMDFRAEICGFDKFTPKPFLYYINPVQDINVVMCIKECPLYTVEIGN